jgi:hypothetical protein
MRMADPRRKRARLDPAEEYRQWAITLWLIVIAGGLGAIVLLVWLGRYG